MAKICFLYFDLHTGYYPSFHHGLASIIGTLKAGGHTIFLSHLIDESDFDKALGILQKEKPDVIALSFTTNQKKYVRYFFDKAEVKARLIIAGGVHCTLLGEKIFGEFPEIDGVCIGEGEIPVSELCSSLDKGASYFSTPSFYFKQGNEVVKNEVLPLQDINSLVLPDYTMFNYRRIVEDSGQCFPMMLSRGCPYDCHYCCNHVFKRIYPNSSEYVRFPSIRRAEDILKANLLLYPGAQKIIFADDTFTLNKKWLAGFCEMYKREIGLPFLCNARVETINDGVVGLLKDAGCISIDFGVECGNEWLRNNVLNRRHSNKRIIEAFDTVKKYNIKSFSFNIVGLPFETKEMAEDTIDLNLELRPNFGKCFYFYPYPGSRLYQLCLEFGLLRENYDSVSGYLEAPSLKEVFMPHKEMRKSLEMMQSFFYARLLFSKVGMPLFMEKMLTRVVFFFRTPIVRLLDPGADSMFVKGFRKLMRRIAMKYLR